MSQPPFNPGSVHTEDEFAQTEVPQDANGDPVWNPEEPQAGNPLNLQQQWHPEQNQPLQSAQEASQIAGAALHLCDSNNIDLNGKLYLKIEAWTGIAGIAGSVPGIETVKDNVLGGVPGITARSSLKNASGKLLSEAEGFVGQDETFWASKPVSDRVNMAQTRAVGRVCRLVYSYIVQIMNKEYGRRFEMTPAEEILASQRQGQAVHPLVAGGFAKAMTEPPQMGTRQPFVPSQPPNITPFTPNVPPSITHPTPGHYPNQPIQPIPLPYPAQPPQPNIQQPVGQDEVWQGQLRDINIKWVNTSRGQSQLFIISLTDGRSASTFDKTIAGNAQMAQGRNVEMIVKPRGQGRYNVQQVRPL